MSQPKHTLFPRNLDDRVADLNTKKDYLESNNTRLNIPEEELLTINMNVTAMNTAYTVASNRDMRSKIDVAVRNEAIETAQITVRRVIDFFVIGNPNANAVDYEALNIPTPRSRHLLPKPDSVPGIRKLVSHSLAVMFEFFDAITGKRAKPAGVQAIEISYKIGGEQPADVSGMTEHRIATSSPVHMQFNSRNDFEIIYLAFRWLGTRGDYGPWSEIYKIVITR
jgi:hypothetical protein